LNGEAFEDDVFGEVERDGFRGEAEERDASAAADDEWWWLEQWLDGR
jgi:hypothetical protein